MNGDQKSELLADAQAIHDCSLQLEALARTLTHVSTDDDAANASLIAVDLVHIMVIFRCDLDLIRDIAKGIILTLERDGDPVRLGAATAN